MVLKKEEKYCRFSIAESKFNLEGVSKRNLGVSSKFIMTKDTLIIKGAREHNLKNIDLELPKNKLIVFTGLSGSGKSSLAFDTIYAEGQRRYVESLSSYARQFLGVMKKPDVDQIEGLSPAISIDQKSTSHNPRSTVGTITEIYDYLRLLFARIGHPHCPNCGREVSKMSIDQIFDEFKKLVAHPPQGGLRIMILAPLVKDRKGEFKDLFVNLKKQGLTKVRVDRQIMNIDEDFVLLKTNKHTIDAVIDRMVINKEFDVNRVRGSIEQALKLSNGEVIIAKVQDASFEFPENPKEQEDFLFSEKFACPVCGIALSPLEPRSFSFNSPQGACPTCTGLGTILTVDTDLVLNPRLTISEGGILPFANLMEHDTWFARVVRTFCDENAIPLNVPIGQLSDEKKYFLLYGTGDQVYRVEGTNRQGEDTQIYETFQGFIKELERRYKVTDSDYIRREIEKFMRYEVCKTCGGTRLKKEALSVTVDGKTIYEITTNSVDDAFNFSHGLYQKISGTEKTIAAPILKELVARLQFLQSVGLTYLTIDRSTATLAGGEAQRIRLASQIGSGLSGVLYVLDEPSIGLHPRDNRKLIDTLVKLRDLGNSVIVVEHDQETMETSDYIVDFGPKAGREGGEIIAQGTPNEIKQDPNSITGKYISGKKKIKRVAQNHEITANTKYLTIKGASAHNLKHIDVSFPLGKLIAITGVSGSGKSTLMHDILYHALMQELVPFHKEKPGKFESIEGLENINRVILLDQSPIGRTPRSNPATYTGAFTFIRELFAQTKDAKLKGYKAGRFSFNVPGGRCENCQGEGEIKIEMQFLADVYVTCEVCNGKRYNRDTLDILYKDKNISDVLDMTVEEAVKFFDTYPPLASKLQTLNEVGLSYIKLGQSALTLSGGEAQRVKIATELSKRSTGKTVYLLDEPTTGLHFADLEKLLEVLSKLVESGNTVIVIEHNLDVIANADYIIDLGPEGGSGGGEIVAVGSPHHVAQVKESYTGQFLHEILY